MQKQGNIHPSVHLLHPKNDLKIDPTFAYTVIVNFYFYLLTGYRNIISKGAGWIFDSLGINCTFPNYSRKFSHFDTSGASPWRISPPNYFKGATNIRLKENIPLKSCSYALRDQPLQIVQLHHILSRIIRKKWEDHFLILIRRFMKLFCIVRRHS